MTDALHDPDPAALATLALHGGGARPAPTDPVSPAIITASSFHADPASIGFSAAALEGAPPPFYARWGNPTVALLEERLALLEQGAGAVAFASGMAAVAALFLARLKAGDHLIVSNVCYAGVAELAHDLLPRHGIAVSAVDTSDLAALEAAIRPGQTRLIHIETPANPILRLTDIAAAAAIAHAAGAELSVDSTIATPVATRPLVLGADHVIHSLTKYLCGHGDTLGGAVISRDAAALRSLRTDSLIHYGATLSPFSAWLILRGLETLTLRMRQHEENARAVADFLQSHPAVERVLWPGLAQGPQADLARRQMQNFSGLLSFVIKGDGAALAQRMAENLRRIAYAVSLGKTKSLIFHIPTEELLASSFHLQGKAAQDYRDVAGRGVFRLSVGLEDATDLIRDLEAVL